MSTGEHRPLIVIAGAGISGMATALALRDHAAERRLPEPRLVVLEPEAHVGGKIRTIRAEGFTCEWGVNGFLNKEPRTLELCRRLGLEDQLLPAAGAFSNRYIYTRGKLRLVQMHPLKFLLSGILPLGAKIRLIRELWVRSRVPEDGDESVASFARRRVGDRAYQVLVDPMQTGIYAGDPEQMSVVSSFPRVVEVEREYGSLIRGMARLARERRRQGQKGALPGAGPTGHLTSFRGGMQTLVDRLAAELGDAVRCGRRVSAMRPEQGGGFHVEVEGGEALSADAVILACPAHQAAPITAGCDAELSSTLAEITYSPMVVVALGFPRDRVAHPLDGFGFLVPRAEGLRLLGALWTSTLFPERAPGDHALIRVMLGGARDPEVLAIDDGQLTETVLREVRVTHGGSVGEPSFSRVFRHRAAIPQYRVGHRDRLERIDRSLARLPGLFVTGNAYRGIGVNDCARNAHEVAQQVLDWLGRRSPSQATRPEPAGSS
jgi:oxygen-dependent protoporphyrinogen oxidase